MSAPLFEGGRGRADANAPDVVGIGQVSLDFVATTQRLPAPGEKADADGLERRPGGQVATTLLGCTRLGLKTLFVGCIGDDAEGRAALEPLRAGGVDVSRVRSHAGVPSRTAQIWIERDSGERAILGCRDPRLVLEEGDLPLESVRSARLLHLDTSDPRPAAVAARAARAAGIPVVLDADAPGAGLEELLPLVDFPVVSRAFAETLFETSRVREALERLLAAGARMAVVTLGDRGALARCGSEEIRCPAWPVEARDTTGAGDAFLAGFVWGLLEGLEAREVLRAAAAAAALNCRALGAQGGLPDRAELRAFLAREQPGPWIDPDAP